MSTILDHDINTLPVSMEFKATEDVATIVVPFAFKENIDDIHLEVNDVDSVGTYTYRLTANNVLTVTPSIPKDSTVYIYRETDVDKSLYTLNDGAVFTASNIDANFTQIRKSQQEIIGRFRVLKSRVDATLSEAGAVIKEAQEATDKANQASKDVADLILGKVKDTQVVTTSGRLQSDKNRDFITPEDFGASTLNTAEENNAKFFDFEQSNKGVLVNFRGNTYKTLGRFTNNRYTDGYFDYGGIIDPTRYVYTANIGSILMLGQNSNNIDPKYATKATVFGTPTSSLFLGNGAGNVIEKSGQTVAIGAGAMYHTKISFDNICLGEWAGMNLQSDVDNYMDSMKQMGGTRNICIGGGSGQFMQKGINNVMIGRNNSISCGDISDAVFIGANCNNGLNMTGWYKEVENFFPWGDYSNVKCTAVGAKSIADGFVGSGTFVGHSVAKQLKAGNHNCFFGTNVGSTLERDIGLGGVKKKFLGNVYCNYTKYGNTLDVMYPDDQHGGDVGGYVSVYFGVGGPAYAGHGHAFLVKILAIDGSKLTIECPYIGGDGLSGYCRIYYTINPAIRDYSQQSQHNVVMGTDALSKAVKANSNVIHGSRAMANSEQEQTGMVVLGMNAMSDFWGKGTGSIFIGYQSGQNIHSDVTGVVAIGTNALTNSTGKNGYSTWVGHNAGVIMQDGGLVGDRDVTNSGSFGSNARVAGAGDIQIGGANTTIYANSAIQVRSDKRDKTDIVSIDDKFVDVLLKLNVKQYRFDKRDYYVDDYRSKLEATDMTVDEINEEMRKQWSNPSLEYKDGSKADKRTHTGLIAQEVQDAFTEAGLDFAGLKHGSENGGCDTYTLAYDQFVPALIRNAQLQQEKINDLETRLAKLETMLKGD